MKRLDIDGSAGEGGGQVLRSAVGLSLATGRPIRLRGIRAGRRRPGLRRQHLTAARAAAEISGGRLTGGEIGSTALDFAPGEVAGGDYRFAVGTAGSTTLLLIELTSDALTETFTGFGQIGVRAEAVAHEAVQEMRRYQKAGVPVGEHLADQLLLPLALAGSGAFVRLPLSRHATTQIDLIGRFLDVPIAVEGPESGRVVVRVG